MSLGTDPPPLPRERTFGALFTVVFALVAAWGAWRGHPVVAAAALGLAVVVALLAWRSPRTLAPANRAWYRLGLLLAAIVSPVVLAIMFYGVITPTALIGRLAGRDVLRRRRPDASGTCWVRRDPPGPDGSSFHRQF